LVHVQALQTGLAKELADAAWQRLQENDTVSPIVGRGGEKR